MRKYWFDSPRWTAAIVFIVLTISQVPAIAQSGADADKKDRIDRMYADYSKDFPAVEDIAPEKALELWKQHSVVFLDTRKPEEMAVSMLPGAITKEQFLKQPQRYKDRMVVAYCTVGYRSGVFARDMAQNGIKMVNLAGSILGWIHAGGPVFDPQGRQTRRVHVFGDRWDLAPAGYETVKFGLWGMIF